MSRPVNFSAGPSMIPVKVLESIASDMVDYKGNRFVSGGSQPPGTGL